MLLNLNCAYFFNNYKSAVESTKEYSLVLRLSFGCQLSFPLYTTHHPCLSSSAPSCFMKTQYLCPLLQSLLSLKYMKNICNLLK
jgi:hypothetical protein